MQRLDRAWLADHPLPGLPAEGGKDARGRVLVVGGAEFVPGALRLTGEAALRSGAGKLQLATVRAAAMSLAVLVPEAAMIALPPDDNGEIAAEGAGLLADRVARCDCLIVGPGMSATETTGALVGALVGQAKAGQTIVLDAAALTCAGDCRDAIAVSPGSVIMTPHHLEMSHLTGVPVEAITADPAFAAQTVAETFNAVVALKGVQTIVAVPGRAPVRFEGGCPGLATGGSGDVLAGLVGGFAARGAGPVAAAGWGVFVHGAAGERLARDVGPTGFLARELANVVPRVLAGLCRE